MCVPVKSNLTYKASVCPENALKYSAGNEGQNFCRDLPEMTAFKSDAVKHGGKKQIHVTPAVSLLPWHTAKHQIVPNDCQQHSALPKTMPTHCMMCTN